jgi:acetyl esterase/lipase
VDCFDGGVDTIDDALSELPLWPADDVGDAATEVWFSDGIENRVRNITRPTLTPYLPEPSAATGTGVVVAPGGGFLMLSWESEGTRVARWLQERGIAAFLLKYRLLDTGPTVESFAQKGAELQAILASGARPARAADQIGSEAVADARRALALVRERGDEWGVRPGRLGFMGFSAGGYLTASVATAVDPTDRPDFAAPIYPAAPDGLVVPADAPPLFTVVATDDPICLDDTVDLYRAWRAAGRSCELHAYATGSHGFGLSDRGLPADTWIDRFDDWLRERRLV